MKQKVLMVHNFYKIDGGEHTVFKNEVELLKKNGHEVYTYTRSNDELNTSRLKLLSLPFATIWSMKTFKEVKCIIREKNIDVVHCHNTFPFISPSVYYAARSMKVPVVQTIHNFRLLCPNGVFYHDHQICEKCNVRQSFFSAIQNKCYRNSKLQTLVVVIMLKIHRWLGTYQKISYIFLTEFNKTKFQSLISKENIKTFVKPNFVKKYPILENMVEKSKKNVFVYVGRLEENKGILFLIEAWKEVSQNYELHIYGDGPLKEFVQQTASELENVVYYGFVTQRDILEDLAVSQALIFSSRLYEGYPMVVAESFSIGIPVVATNLGNQKDIIENSRGGVCYEDNNKDSLADAMQEVINNNTYYSENAINYYRSNLTEESNYKLLLDIYEQL